MTSKIVVNNIEADAGVSTVTFTSNVVRGGSNLHSTGLALGAGSTVGAVTGVTTYYGDGSQLTGISQVGGATGADFNDNVKLRLGTGNDLEIYHNSNHSIIHDNGTGDLKLIGDDVIIQANNDETMAKFIENGAVELYHNGTKKLQTDSDGTVFYDDTFLGDNIKLNLGNSNDLQLFHATAGISTIMHYHSGGEPLHITSNGDIKFKVDANSSGTSGEDGLIIKSNGAVQLYHDNRLRAYTVSNAFYVEQAELNDDCDLMINNKSTSIGNNQKSQIACRVAKDAGGSHGGTNRTAVFGHNYNSSTGGGGFFTIRSNDGTNRDFYMDNSTNLRVNYGHNNIGTTNGTVVGSQSSDIRNKNLVGDGTVSYGLSEVLQLNPIKYQYKKELVNRIGFSAQQVEPIIPESVYDTKQDQDNEGNTVSGDTIKAMYYVDLIPVLVNAIKELKAENDALKKRLDDGGL